MKIIMMKKITATKLYFIWQFLGLYGCAYGAIVLVHLATGLKNEAPFFRTIVHAIISPISYIFNGQAMLFTLMIGGIPSALCALTIAFIFSKTGRLPFIATLISTITSVIAMHISFISLQKIILDKIKIYPHTATEFIAYYEITSTYLILISAICTNVMLHIFVMAMKILK